MPVTVIINLRSNQGERAVSRVTELFAARNFPIDEPILVKNARELHRTVKRAVRHSDDLIIVGGGDGSMTEAVNVLAHRKTALGVLPLGTGNSFAQTLGLKGDLEQAVDAIVAGRIEEVDLGIANRRYFANFATVGFPAEVAASAPRFLKRIVGVVAYVIGAVRPFVTQGPFTASVHWDEGRMRFRTRQIIVASGRFFGNQPLSSEASITSGKLAFFTTTGVSHAEVVRTYLALALGQQHHLPDAHAFASEKIVVRARPRQITGIDGEPLGTTPVRFSVARRALRVIVPAGFPEGPG
jgi:diacylglycerol kinase (ATP)